MLRQLIPVLAMLFIAACGDPDAAPDASSASPASGDYASAAPVAESNAGSDAGAATAAKASNGSAREVTVDSDLMQFHFAYPAEAGAIPALRTTLDSQLERHRSELEAQAREMKADAAQDGYPYHAHAFDKSWQVVAQTPRWLSLSADIYTFSGGAHGMSNFDALLWDKQANEARETASLFTSADALRGAIRQPFCARLDAERAKRRGGPVKRSGEWPNDCIDPLESTVILGSSNGRTFDRIGVLIPPYEAGAYAEGSYEVTLPVTQRVMDAIKPAYRHAFSIM